MRRHALRVGLVVQGLFLLLARGMLEMDRTGADRLDLRGLPILFVAVAVIAAIIVTMRRPFLATPLDARR